MALASGAKFGEGGIGQLGQPWHKKIFSPPEAESIPKSHPSGPNGCED